MSCERKQIIYVEDYEKPEKQKLCRRKEIKSNCIKRSPVESIPKDKKAYSKFLKDLFHEAISHCRWVKSLMGLLNDLDISDYENLTFNQIYDDISDKCSGIYGLGPLTTYDIVSALCYFYKIKINIVVLVGNGPKRAATILGLKSEYHQISPTKRIRYTTISNVKQAFANKGYKLSNEIKHTLDGDKVESFLCNWQKKN